MENTFEDAITSAKEVPFDLVFDRLGIQYDHKNWNLVDYLCPFHDHKTGTFHASKWMRQKNVCHCFACNEHYDTIEFVKQMQNIGFKEAIVWLLEQSGQIDDFPVLTGKVKEERKPYQLRYLSEKEKTILGFNQDNGYHSTPGGRIIGISPTKPKEGVYDYEMDGDFYIIYEPLENPWKMLMRDDPLGYRIMVLTKIAECMETLELKKKICTSAYWEKELKEEEAILKKVAKDFGYYRVLQQIKAAT